MTKTKQTAPKKPRAKRVDAYVCSFCEKGFTREAAFLDHTCVQMERHHKMKTNEGMSAWMAYSLWLKAQGKKVPPQTSFLSSQFYQSFMRFAVFLREVKTIRVDQYVANMVKNNIPPVVWTNPAIYNEWIRSQQNDRPPIKIVESTTLFLLDHASANKFDISELFQHVTSSEVCEWIRLGDVSPWFLLGSAKFKTWYASLAEEDHNYFADVLDPAEWVDKLKSNPNTLSKIKAIVAELGL